MCQCVCVSLDECASVYVSLEECVSVYARPWKCVSVCVYVCVSLENGCRKIKACNAERELKLALTSLTAAERVKGQTDGCRHAYPARPLYSALS